MNDEDSVIEREIDPGSGIGVRRGCRYAVVDEVFERSVRFAAVMGHFSAEPVDDRCVLCEDGCGDREEEGREKRGVLQGFAHPSIVDVPDLRRH